MKQDGHSDSSFMEQEMALPEALSQQLNDSSGRIAHPIQNILFLLSSLWLEMTFRHISLDQILSWSFTTIMLSSTGGASNSQHFQYLISLKYPSHSSFEKISKGWVRGLLVQIMTLLGQAQMTSRNGFSLMTILQFLPQKSTTQWSIFISGSLHFRPPISQPLQMKELNLNCLLRMSYGRQKQEDLAISPIMSSPSLRLGQCGEYLKRSCSTFLSWRVRERKEDDRSSLFWRWWQSKELRASLAYFLKRLRKAYY